MHESRFPISGRVKTIVFDSWEELSRLTLPFLLKGDIALSGGSTFGSLFPLWVKMKPDCCQATFFPVDERLVDFDDPRSNWGMAYREFLSPVGRPDDKANFATSANQYRALLREHFKAEMPVLDVVFLGVGDDGHTASLFPGEPYLDDLTSVVLETKSPKPPYKRVTLAMAPLLAAKTVIMILAGKGKKPLVKDLFSNKGNLPLHRVLRGRTASLLFVESSLSE
jgi:6-phosphogluconolactonase